MPKLDHLRGRVAVISGAGSGIGAGLARFAASQLAMTVAVADRDVTRAHDVAARLRSAGAAAIAIEMDVCDWTSVRSGSAEILTDLGVPAFLACNAGIEHTGLAWEANPSDWERVQRVNVLGAYHVQRAFVPAMVKHGQPGEVLFTSSLGGISIGASQSAYLVSKHAVRVLAQTLQADLASVGSALSVSVLMPGAVRTRIFEDAHTTGDPEAEAYRRTLAAHLADDGMTPDAVAAITFAHIAAGRSWIYTHPAEAREYLRDHTAELLASIDPEPG
jgi:NAD(P)-dependent dehydrogenase (short-subunit alcohol dehydrogenase family)